MEKERRSAYRPENAENNSANAGGGAGGLLEKIVGLRNLNRAYKRMKKNKGAGETDRTETDMLLQYLKKNGDVIRESIMVNTYRPKTVRRVEIPKRSGKTRKLNSDVVQNCIFSTERGLT